MSSSVSVPPIDISKIQPHHHEKYDEDLIKKLQDDDQVAFTYDNNPNGSMSNIAGIFNRNRNVLGMMPHPERAAESILGSSDGLAIFESLIEHI